MEGERGGIRDTFLYPLLREWSDRGNFRCVLDVGCGQGIASTIVRADEYVGVEPSVYLVERAKERYANQGTFVVGSAYALPFPDATFDAACSINVWFHLKDITSAAREVGRTLQRGGQFLIITANPEAYSVWETLYEQREAHEGMFIGRAHIPLVTLPKNTFYTHTNDAIIAACEEADLLIDEIRDTAPHAVTGTPLFRAYFLRKTRP